MMDAEIGIYVSPAGERTCVVKFNGDAICIPIDPVPELFPGSEFRAMRLPMVAIKGDDPLDPALSERMRQG